MGPINNMPALPELEALFVIKGQSRESKKNESNYVPCITSGDHWETKGDRISADMIVT